MLSKALKDKDGSKNAYIGRLLDAQVGVDEEEQATEDYGQAQEIEELEAQQRALDANPSPQLADPLSLDSEMGSLELP